MVLEPLPAICLSRLRSHTALRKQKCILLEGHREQNSNPINGLARLVADVLEFMAYCP